MQHLYFLNRTTVLCEPNITGRHQAKFLYSPYTGLKIGEITLKDSFESFAGISTPAAVLINFEFVIVISALKAIIK